MKNKLISLLLTLVMCLSSLSMVFATGGLTVTPTKPATLPTGANDMVNNVLGIIQVVGMVIAIFIVLFFGFKYLTAGAGEKAETKKMMIPFVIGAAVIGVGPAVVKWAWELLLPSVK